MESLELFGREVLPEFAERDERREREKEARLEPVIEKVMARKPAADHPPLLTATTRSRRSPRSRPTAPSRREFHDWLDQFEHDLAAGEDIRKRLA